MVDERTPDWTGDWEASGLAQRRAWRETTPDERLRWLEDALVFALEAGTLPQERARRAAAARRWAEDDAGAG
jgi:hypothetical protein